MQQPKRYLDELYTQNTSNNNKKYKTTHNNEIHKLQLAKACVNGYVHLIPNLLQQGNQENHDINLALRLATKHNHINIVQLLLNSGISCDLNSALYWACRGGNKQIALCLINRGAYYCEYCDNTTHNLYDRIYDK